MILSMKDIIMSYMDRIILHSDINACYASVELLFKPELRGLPMAVGGDVERRHGIVLSKTEEAKRAGVKTGMTLWEAQSRCPELIILQPHFDRYLYYSRALQEIYADYTDRREPFGIDESWLDLTGCIAVKDGASAAQEIRERVKNETGLTVSIGVSWNKIFAKLGSDHKKPDAVTVIDRENYRSLVWNKPVGELLYVGRATERRLRDMGIRSIGELAAADERLLRLRLGKNGAKLHAWANGWDCEPVRRAGTAPAAKSIGNGTTPPRDMRSAQEALPTLTSLAESVGARLRRAGVLAGALTVDMRTTELSWSSHGGRLNHPTDCDRELLAAAMERLTEAQDWRLPLRSVAIRAEELIPIAAPSQLDIFCDYDRLEKQRRLDKTVDRLRCKYGLNAVMRGSVFATPEMAVPPAQEEFSFVKDLKAG